MLVQTSKQLSPLPFTSRSCGEPFLCNKRASLQRSTASHREAIKQINNATILLQFPLHPHSCHRYSTK